MPQSYKRGGGVSHLALGGQCRESRLPAPCAGKPGGRPCAYREHAAHQEPAGKRHVAKHNPHKKYEGGGKKVASQYPTRP